MLLNNATEAAVRAEINARSGGGSREGTGCWCPSCKADLLALSLGSLAPHYWTSPDSRDFMGEGLSDKVAEAVTLSAEQVAKYPKHRGQDEGKTTTHLRLVNFNHDEGTAVI